MLQASYDLEMMIEAYWEVVTGRMVDNMGNGLERMLDELASVAKKRKKLQSSVKIGVNADMLQASYDLEMMIEAYWEVVTGRMVDNMVLHLMLNIGKVVNKKM
ncbi:hypothetical protein SASPL_133388 [Salvia splendens]|uniref:Uncharacterized protein n=1 Tax=Salvia splendens TaxID=180675 RepID=A0A8X8ZJ26_SALSN|nr:hypothetical protein SASPL_133388 [Salvia splendens]